MSRSVRRVREALQAAGVADAVREMPDSTRTAADAAAALGCSVAAIAKSLVFHLPQSDAALLVIASGANQVDTDKLARLVGEKPARADAGFVRARTGFAIGGVPPLGHTEPIKTLVDEDLLALDQVWAAAGSPHAVFPLDPGELARLTGGEVADVRRD